MLPTRGNEYINSAISIALALTWSCVKVPVKVGMDVALIPIADKSLVLKLIFVKGADLILVPPAPKPCCVNIDLVNFFCNFKISTSFCILSNTLFKFDLVILLISIFL